MKEDGSTRFGEEGGDESLLDDEDEDRKFAGVIDDGGGEFLCGCRSG